jgi:hypothetical protein
VSSYVRADNMFELHPSGTLIEFHDDLYTVGEDGLWRNRFGQVPAGQVNPPPEALRPAKHCRGCRCDELPPAGRMAHGGAL